MEESAYEAAMGLLTVSDDYEAMAGVDMAIEAVIEKVDLKQKVRCCCWVLLGVVVVAVVVVAVVVVAVVVDDDDDDDDDDDGDDDDGDE